MQIAMVLEHHMMLRVFDTQFGEQGMENIGEIWYCLVPFLMQGGPSSVLVLVASNKIVIFFNDIPHRGRHKYFIFLYYPLLRVSVPPVLNMGGDLECKSNIFPIEKIMHRKISFEEIQPFIYNIRIY
jgi:hypothetical protein